MHPLDHVNASQSTNDVYPTAVKLALHLAVQRLLAAMDELRQAFAAKAEATCARSSSGRSDW